VADRVTSTPGEADSQTCRLLALCGGAGEIHAIIGPYAVQLTSIDALPQRTLANKQFERVAGDLEGELRQPP
jgi:hypothetical protein